MKKKKVWKKVLIIVLAVVLLIGVGGFAAYKIFGSKVLTVILANKPGNASEYSVEAVEENPESPLRGKTIIFLGSSVTDGYGACGTSFVEYLEKIDGVNGIKEAVGGTTLVTTGTDSYIPRMETIDTSIAADAFVCQLSTNDATKELPLGTVSESFDRADFDTSTVAGAIEYIISYAGDTWNCPVVFYTGTKYDSEAYGDMVALLLEISDKWDCGVIDLWNDAGLNDITDEQRSLYMLDGIHPTKAGYLEWWLPAFEAGLEDILG